MFCDDDYALPKPCSQSDRRKRRRATRLLRSHMIERKNDKTEDPNSKRHLFRTITRKWVQPGSRVSVERSTYVGPCENAMSIFHNLRSSSYHLACSDFSSSSLLSSFWTCGQFSKYRDVTTGFYAFSDIPKSLEFLMEIYSIPILLPTKCLRTSNTWHKTSTKSSHTRGCTGIWTSRNERRWHSDLYSIRGNANLFLQCINIPQCRHFAMGLNQYHSVLLVCYVMHQATGKVVCISAMCCINTDNIALCKVFSCH